MDGCRRNMRRRSVSGCGGAGLPAQLRHAFCLRSERDFRPRFAAYFRAGRQAVPADLPAYRPGDKRYMLCLQGRDGDRIRGLLRYADERRHGPDADTRRHRHERQRVYAQPLVRLLHKGQHLSRRPVRLYPDAGDAGPCVAQSRFGQRHQHVAVGCRFQEPDDHHGGVHALVCGRGPEGAFRAVRRAGADVPHGNVGLLLCAGGGRQEYRRQQHAGTHSLQLGRRGLHISQCVLYAVIRVGRFPVQQSEPEGCCGQCDGQPAGLEAVVAPELRSE